jgi:ketosteroid isomerase-like protein
VANEQVVEVDEFETSDPAMQGEMTITITLTDSNGGTDLVAMHDGLPPGVSPGDNETGWRMALAKLAALVEAGYAEQELTAVAHAWDRAMIENDAEAIGQYMADDWTIIGPDGSVSDKAAFLGLVKSGALTHDVMTSEDLNIRVYGDTAVVIARGVSGGKYHGQSFREAERVSCVFVRQERQWRCVLTHLSRLGGTP